MTTKLCTACATEKTTEEFYKNSRKCKPCTCLAVRINRKANLDRVQEYDRARSRLPHRVAARQRYAKSEVGKEAFARAHQTEHERFPERRAARTALSNALRDRRITQAAACECGAIAHLEAHHDDYSKPLDVRWLCIPCHKALHAKDFTPGSRSTQAQRHGFGQGSGR